MGALQTAIGMFLCVGAAFLLALSMSIQQYALSCPDEAKILKKLNRDALWSLGLSVYLIAQLCFVAAIGMGPFAVMSALFTSVLFFDYLIAYFARGKKPTQHEAAGLAIISAAVIMCAIFSPKESGEVTPAAVAHWSGAWSGVTVFVVMGSLLAACITSVKRFEKQFPHYPCRDKKSRAPQPSVRQIEIMRLVYPTVLASFETLGAASLKAVSGMILPKDDKGDSSEGTIHEEDGPVVATAAFWLAIIVWLFCIANTVIWLRKVYEKFKTTECLPTEIGLTTFLSILVALLFYEERKHADSTLHLAMLVVSASIILVGIYVMTMKHAVDTGPSEAHDHIRQYPMARFPAKKVWTRSIQKVMIANSLEHHSYHHLDFAKNSKQDLPELAPVHGKSSALQQMENAFSGVKKAVVTVAHTAEEHIIAEAHTALQHVEEVGSVLTRSNVPSNQVVPVASDHKQPKLQAVEDSEVDASEDKAQKDDVKIDMQQISCSASSASAAEGGSEQNVAKSEEVIPGNAVATEPEVGGGAIDYKDI